MADTSQQLIEAIEALEEVADAITPEVAAAELDETSLQVFWRDWPQISSWAGSLWRRLNQEMAEPASPADREDVDIDIGGSE